MEFMEIFGAITKYLSRALYPLTDKIYFCSFRTFAKKPQGACCQWIMNIMNKNQKQISAGVSVLKEGNCKLVPSAAELSVAAVAEQEGVTVN